MKIRNCICASALFLLGCTFSFGQDVPKVELAGGYSYVNFHPGLPQITSQNLNGGGGAFVYNVMPLIGIKADFMGYALGSGWTNQLHQLGFPATASVSGNLFTYMFGPQFKSHSHKLQPFGEVLFGASHSNGYGTLLQDLSTGTVTTTKNNSGNGFAMEFGGGLDYALSEHVQIRPVEADFLLTHFGSTNYSAYQKNFKYFAGLNFTFGSK